MSHQIGKGRSHLSAVCMLLRLARWVWQGNRAIALSSTLHCCQGSFVLRSQSFSVGLARFNPSGKAGYRHSAGWRWLYIPLYCTTYSAKYRATTLWGACSYVLCAIGGGCGMWVARVLGWLSDLLT
jgi:hypothetical protein